MQSEVRLPQLGESVVEGTITKWLVKVGAKVTRGQPLVEIGTDKTDTELPAPIDGIVVKLAANEGDVVPVNTVICVIDSEASATASTTPKPPEAAASPDTKRPLASPETRRMARNLGVDPAKLEGSGEFGRVTRDDVMEAAKQPAPQDETPMIPSRFPAALAPVRMPDTSLTPANAKGVYVPPIPGVGFGAFKVPPFVERPGDKIVPFSRRRKLTAAHMVYSKQVAPQVVTVAEVDMFAVTKLREANKERYKKDGVGLTFLAFTTHAVAQALKEYPSLNARVLEDSFVLLRDINVGIAVDTKEGLVVPVIRHAGNLNVRGLALAIDDLARKSRDGNLTPDDLSSGTFSISNPGLKGNLYGGAIISQPNVGILRLGEIKKRVVVVEHAGQDTIAIHPMMYIALTYDHRIVDGVEANAFLYRIRELLEAANFEV
jgi:2-oxoglutarate dehydrogenase E2 component (dihydrolipoamide succinyltransferase)